jgi:hypothetical protein
LGRDVEGLQQAGGLQRLRLVPLTCAARPHEVLDESAVARNVEVSAQAMKRLLNPLMARQVSQEEHLVAQVIMGWRKDAGTVQQEPVVEAPGRSQRAILEALEQLAVSAAAAVAVRMSSMRANVGAERSWNKNSL